jgi:hypothetical protein
MARFTAPPERLSMSFAAGVRVLSFFTPTITAPDFGKLREANETLILNSGHGKHGNGGRLSIFHYSSRKQGEGKAGSQHPCSIPDFALHFSTSAHKRPYVETRSNSNAVFAGPINEDAEKSWPAWQDKQFGIGSERNMTALRLSALVVAHNEEAQLEDCLRTLEFVDELVVVLDKCTDGSKAIAERLADRVIEGAWELQGSRLEVGVAGCTGDWILDVDADERVTAELAKEIRETILHAAPGYFLIPFDNFVGTKLVRYGWGGSFGVSAAVRLYTPGAKQWGDQTGHPEITLQGEKRRLKSPMIHYHDRDISDMIQRFDRYTTARARDMRAAGQIGTFASNFRRVFTRFFKCYIQRKGYREGYYGFLIGLFAGLLPLISHLKARLEND